MSLKAFIYAPCTSSCHPNTLCKKLDTREVLVDASFASVSGVATGLFMFGTDTKADSAGLLHNKA